MCISLKWLESGAEIEYVLSGNEDFNKCYMFTGTATSRRYSESVHMALIGCYFAFHLKNSPLRILFDKSHVYFEQQKSSYCDVSLV